MQHPSNSPTDDQFLALAAPLAQRVGWPGVERIAAAAAQIAGDQLPAYIGLLRLSAGLLDRLRMHVDHEGALQVFDSAAGIARQHRTPAVHFLENSPEIAARVGSGGLARLARLAAEIAAACPPTATALIQKSAPLYDRLDAEGLWAFGRFCARMAAAGPGMAVRFPEQSLELMDRLLVRGGRALVENAYGLAGGLGERHPMLAYKMLEKSPDLIERIGLEGLAAVGEMVSQLSQVSWTAADGLLKASTGIIDCMGREGLALMADLSRDVAARNVYGALSLLEKSPAVLGRLVEAGGQALAREVLSMSARAALQDWMVAMRLFDISPDFLDRADVHTFSRVAAACMQMTAQGTASALALLETCVGIIAAADQQTLLLTLDFWLQAAAEGGDAADPTIKNMPQVIEALMEQGGPTLPARVLRLVQQMAAANREAAFHLLARSPELIGAAGWEGLRKIAAQVLALTRIDPVQAALFAAGESLEFADFMKGVPQGLRLEQIRPVLFNYLAALLGYRLEIEAGDRPLIDGRKIVLPAKVREFEDDALNFLYYKVLATRLEAHLEYGGFDFVLAQAQPAIDMVRDRYKSEVLPRDGEPDTYYQLFPEPGLAEDLVSLLEAYRLDHRLSREYPVLGKQLHVVQQHDLKKRGPWEKIPNRKQRAVEMLAQALPVEQGRIEGSVEDEQLLLFAREQIAALDGDEAGFAQTLSSAAALYFRIDAAFSEAYRPLRRAANEKLDAQQINTRLGSFGKTSRNIIERLQGQEGRQTGAGGVETEGPAAKETPSPAQNAPRQARVPHARRRAAGEQRPLDSAADTTDEAGAQVSAEQRETGGSSGMKFSSARMEKLLRKLFKEKGVTPNEVEQKIKPMRPDQLGLFLQGMESLVKVDGELEKEKGTRRYPEWDDSRNDYRSNWSRIREQELPAGDNAFYRRTLLKHAGLLKKVRREFQMLKPEELARLDRQTDGEEIDLDAAVEYFIDRKAGVTPSEKYYQRSQKNSRDIAVALLVDMSKSTRGETLRCEKEALVIFSEALKEVGDTFALFGFSGDNRDNVDYYRIKNFEEPLNPQVQRRIAAIDFGLENRDGTALRHTIRLMKGREEKTKLLILLSDGKPVDKEYAGRYAIEDTRKALIEAQKAGIKTFCITIDSHAADYLPRMYSHSSWVVIDDVARLPEKITRIFARLTT